MILRFVAGNQRDHAGEINEIICLIMLSKHTEELYTTGSKFIRKSIQFLVAAGI
jgi:hypothetical protein